MLWSALRTAIRVASVAVVIASFAVSPVLPARASGSALFSVPTPAPGASVTDLPVISLHASDANGIVSFSMLLDGVSVAATLERDVLVPGYWQDDGDGCGAYWVPETYDPNAGTVRYSGIGVLNGSHDVTVTVTSGTAEQSQYAWSFDSDVAPRVFSPDPAPASTHVLSAPTSISAVLDVRTVGYEATMTVNGVVVPATFSAATHRLTYASGSLPDNTYSVRVDLRDDNAESTTLSWSFVVDSVIDIAFSNEAPGSGATITTWNPTVLVFGDSATQLRGTGFRPNGRYARAWIDGVAQTTSSAYRVTSEEWVDDGCELYLVRYFDYTDQTLSFPTTMLLDGPHSVRFQFADVDDRLAERTWNFTVAAPPQVIVSPGDGMKVQTLTPTLSASVADNGPSTTATATLDGELVALAYNGATKTYSHAVTEPLDDFSQHVFTVTVTDDQGHKTTVSSEFGVQITADTQFLAKSPAPDSTVAIWNPQVSVLASSTVALRPPTRREMRIDGVAVQTQDTWAAADTRLTMAHTPAKLADGEHTVWLSVTDSVGLVATDSWAFSVNASPTISAISPAEGAVVSTLTPAIQATIDDNGPGGLTWDMWVNGQSVSPSLSSAVLSWTPTEPLRADTSCAVVLRVTDASGNVTERSWSFVPEPAAAMSASGTCTSCHVGYPSPKHPMSNCSGCHRGNGTIYEHGAGDGAPMAQCWDCHGSPPPTTHSNAWSGMSSCTWCHSGTWSQIPWHPADLDGVHTNTGMQDSCRSCHTSKLLREHMRHTDDLGASYTCNTCHGAAASERVQSAIADGDSDCYACHEGHPHGAGFEPDEMADGLRECSECHSSDLVDEHVKATSNGFESVCDTCHVIDGPVDSMSATWTGRCDDPVCHGSASAQPMHTTYCLGCHDDPAADFAAAQTSFAGGALEMTGCADCHGTGISTFGSWKAGRRYRSARHLSHDPYDECASCHFWKERRTSWRYSHFAETDYGLFASSTSPTMSAGFVHEQHLSGSWPKAISFNPTIYCASCHGVAGCASCHDTASIPPEHAQHVPVAGSRTVAAGSMSYVGALSTRQEPAGCLQSRCHTTSTSVPSKATYPETALTRSGTWARRGDARSIGGAYYESSGQTGESLTLSVEGPAQVTLIGIGGADCGIGEVLIDGVSQGTFDSYELAYPYYAYYPLQPIPAFGMPLFESDELGAGLHTIEIRATGLKNSLAAGTKLRIDSIEVRDRVSVEPQCSGCHADRMADHW